MPFDTASGIPVEEQRQILADINALAERERLAAPPRFTAAAKKRGFRFPLLVNLGAVLLLGAGFWGIRAFHRQEDAAIRESAASLGITERKLIQEIRRETARLIAEKDAAISDTQAKLTAADAEYQALQLEAERETSQANLQYLEKLRALLELQDAYRHTLTTLNKERSQLLENARVREANLYAQLEERAGILSGELQKGQRDLSAAREELGRLSDEQERLVQIEGQLGGFYRNADQQIQDGLLDEAAGTAAYMREFLNTPAFQSLRPFQIRKDLYLSAARVLETMIAEGRRLKGEAAGAVPAAPPPPPENAGDTGAAEAEYERTIAALREQVAALEQAGRERAASLTGLDAQNSAQARRISEFERALDGLEQTLSERDASIAGLRAANAAQAQQLSERDAAISSLRSAGAARDQQLAERESAVGSLRSQQSAQTQQITELTAAVTALRQESAAKEQTIEGLRQEGSAKDRSISELRTQSGAKDQAIRDMEAQISGLNQQITTIRQALQALSQ